MSDYVPDFRLSSPVIVDPEEDDILAFGGDGDLDSAVRLGRMSPDERNAYLREIIGRLTGETSGSSTSPVSGEATTVAILSDVSTDYDEGAYIGVIIVGGIIVLWFLVTVLNSVYRFSSSRLLTVDGLGEMLHRFVLTVATLLALRRRPLSSETSSQVPLCRLDEVLRESEPTEEDLERTLSEVGPRELDNLSNEALDGGDDRGELSQTLGESMFQHDVERPELGDSYNAEVVLGVRRLESTPYPVTGLSFGNPFYMADQQGDTLVPAGGTREYNLGSGESKEFNF